MGLKDIARNFKLKMVLRKMEQRSYSISDIFSISRRILLLLPSGTKDTPDMKSICSELGGLFKNASFSIISPPDNEVTAGSSMPGSAEKLKPDLNELTWSGLPGKGFLDKIKNLNADLLIDLSIKKNYYNAYITASSQVPIRIGNYGSWGNSLYNLQIKTNYLQNEQLIAKSIIDVLKDFRAGVNN